MLRAVAGCGRVASRWKMMVRKREGERGGGGVEERWGKQEQKVKRDPGTLWSAEHPT